MKPEMIKPIILAAFLIAQPLWADTPKTAKPANNYWQLPKESTPTDSRGKNTGSVNLDLSDSTTASNSLLSTGTDGQDTFEYGTPKNELGKTPSEINIDSGDDAAKPGRQNSPFNLLPESPADTKPAASTNLVDIALGGPADGGTFGTAPAGRVSGTNNKNNGTARPERTNWQKRIVDFDLIISGKPAIDLLAEDGAGKTNAPGFNTVTNPTPSIFDKR